MEASGDRERSWGIAIAEGLPQGLGASSPSSSFSVLSFFLIDYTSIMCFFFVKTNMWSVSSGLVLSLVGYTLDQPNIG